MSSSNKNFFLMETPLSSNFSRVAHFVWSRRNRCNQMRFDSSVVISHFRDVDSLQVWAEAGMFSLLAIVTRGIHLPYFWTWTLYVMFLMHVQLNFYLVYSTFSTKKSVCTTKIGGERKPTVYAAFVKHFVKASNAHQVMMTLIMYI